MEVSIVFAVTAQDSNIIVGGSTIVLVIVTTLNILKIDEIFRKQRILSIDPLVQIYAKENNLQVQVIDLIIENVGSGIAKNLRITVDNPAFITVSGDPIGRLHFFRNPIQILAPKQKYVIHFTNFAERVNEHRLADGGFNVEELKRAFYLKFYLTYQNVDGDTKSGEFHVDLCTFWGLRYPAPRPFNQYP